jgi:uncharacterized protein YkwD
MVATRAAFPDQTDPGFRTDMLDRINAYRAQHGAPPLVLDDELISYAKERAALMSTQERLSHGHAGLKSEYGENASWQASSQGTVPASAAGAVDSWYSENANYNFNEPGQPLDPGKAIGHFTAMVWKGTTKLGVGRVAGQGSQYWETYIVANFFPAPNMEGEYAANVLPKQG